MGVWSILLNNGTPRRVDDYLRSEWRVIRGHVKLVSEEDEAHLQEEGDEKRPKEEVLERNTNEQEGCSFLVTESNSFTT